MSRESYVTVEATVRFIVYVHRARQEGMTGRKNDIALDVVSGSAGAEFDNMVQIESVSDCQLVKQS